MRFWAIALAATLAADGAVAKTHHLKHRRQPAAELGSAAGASRDPNGIWNIDAATTVGTCPGLIPTSLTLVDNKITGSAGANLKTWGYLDEEGNLVARFTGAGEHERVARFHGTLKGGRGSGAWSSSTDMCGGTWRGSQE